MAQRVVDRALAMVYSLVGWPDKRVESSGPKQGKEVARDRAMELPMVTKEDWNKLVIVKMVVMLVS